MTFRYMPLQRNHFYHCLIKSVDNCWRNSWFNALDCVLIQWKAKLPRASTLFPFIWNIISVVHEGTALVSYFHVMSVHFPGKTPFAIYTFRVTLVTTHHTLTWTCWLFRLQKSYLTHTFACNMLLLLKEWRKSLFVAIALVSLERSFITQIYDRINFQCVAMNATLRHWATRQKC